MFSKCISAFVIFTYACVCLGIQSKICLLISAVWQSHLMFLFILETVLQIRFENLCLMHSLICNYWDHQLSILLGSSGKKFWLLVWLSSLSVDISHIFRYTCASSCSASVSLSLSLFQLPSVCSSTNTNDFSKHSASCWKKSIFSKAPRLTSTNIDGKQTNQCNSVNRYGARTWL